MLHQLQNFLFALQFSSNFIPSKYLKIILKLFILSNCSCMGHNPPWGKYCLILKSSQNLCEMIHYRYKYLILNKQCPKKKFGPVKRETRQFGTHWKRQFGTRWKRQFGTKTFRYRWKKLSNRHHIFFRDYLLKNKINEN